jgi:hypothetical protein
MATTITAGNSTNGAAAITPDNTGILELKTGSGAGTTALTLGTSQQSTFAGPVNLSNQLNLAAGTTTIAPVDFVAGTNLTTALAGAVEYDGRVFYATPQGTQRGVVRAAQFFRLNSTVVGSNVTTAQSVFGVGVTLSADTVYAFEAVYAFLKTAGATSHTFGLGFGGTATINNIAYRPITTYSYTGLTTLATNTTGPTFVQTLSNTNIQSGLASATVALHTTIHGTISVNAGGTLIPQYTLSVAPGGGYTTQIGSYFLIYPIGAAGANTSVGTWA